MNINEMRVETARAFGRAGCAVLRFVFVIGFDEILVIALEFFKFAQGSVFG